MIQISYNCWSSTESLERTLQRFSNLGFMLLKLTRGSSTLLLTLSDPQTNTVVKVSARGLVDSQARIRISKMFQQILKKANTQKTFWPCGNTYEGMASTLSDYETISYRKLVMCLSQG